MDLTARHVAVTFALGTVVSAVEDKICLVRLEIDEGIFPEHVELLECSRHLTNNETREIMVLDRYLDTYGVT